MTSVGKGKPVEWPVGNDYEPAFCVQLSLILNRRVKPEHSNCNGISDIFWGFCHPLFRLLCSLCVCPRNGELRMQKLKSHLVRTQSLNVLPLKPAVSQYIAIHAMLTARDFFLAYFYPSGPFTCIFSKTSPNFCCSLWLTHGSCVGPQNKIGQPAWCRFPCWVPSEYK